MTDSRSFCPIALATDVVADRWTPLILRELILGNTRFNDLVRGLPGISRSLLVKRLRHLERKGVVETWPSPAGKGNEYHLTPAGRDLEPVVMALGQWAVRWLFEEIQPHEVDPITLSWWMHRRVDHDQLPDERVVVEFAHTRPERVSVWLVLERHEASVCVQHPGFDTDVLVTTPTPALAEVFQGFETWGHAVETGSIDVDGPRHLVKALPRWFLWSPFVEDTRARKAVGSAAR